MFLLIFVFITLTQIKEVLAVEFESSLVTDIGKWSIEESGAVESVIETKEGWVCRAGGEVAGTHYARLKYKIPENKGGVTNSFYFKLNVILPADFYVKHKAGFRVINTDNYGTTVGGVHYGASDENELRVGVYFNSSHLMQIIKEYETKERVMIWTASNQLVVGEHVFEFYGSVTEYVPWKLLIDGETVASGVGPLAPTSVPMDERVVTRMVVGIDGAADQDLNSMELVIKNAYISNKIPGDLTTIVPTRQVVSTLSPTRILIATPTRIVINCVEQRKKADADCDGVTDVLDFSVWYKQFYDGGKGEIVKSSWEADFTGINGTPDGKVDIYDYSMWLATTIDN